MAAALPRVAHSGWWPRADGDDVSKSKRRRQRLRRTAVLKSVQRTGELKSLLMTGIGHVVSSSCWNPDADIFYPTDSVYCDADLRCFNILMHELAVGSVAGGNNHVEEHDALSLHQHPEGLRRSAVMVRDGESAKRHVQLKFCRMSVFQFLFPALQRCQA